MPHHKSCKKRMRISAEEQLRNRAVRTNLKGSIKNLKDNKNADEADAIFKVAVRNIDKAAQNNVIHKNKAARLKSRLAGHVKSLKQSK